MMTGSQQGERKLLRVYHLLLWPLLTVARRVKVLIVMMTIY